MAKVLSLPFRFTTYNSVQVIEQGGDEYYRQQLVALLLTIAGERIMEPGLGMSDSTFDGFQYSEYQALVEEVFPEIINLEVETEFVNETTEQVSIRFDVDVEAT
jgi:hypothetical protein